MTGVFFGVCIHSTNISRSGLVIVWQLPVIELLAIKGRSGPIQIPATLKVKYIYSETIGSSKITNLRSYWNLVFGWDNCASAGCSQVPYGVAAHPRNGTVHLKTMRETKKVKIIQIQFFNSCAYPSGGISKSDINECLVVVPRQDCFSRQAPTREQIRFLFA